MRPHFMWGRRLSEERGSTERSSANAGVVAISALVAFLSTASAVHADVIRTSTASISSGFGIRDMSLTVNAGDFIVFACQAYTGASFGSTGGSTEPGNEFYGHAPSLILNGTQIGFGESAYLPLQTEGLGSVVAWSTFVHDPGTLDVRINNMQDADNFADACSAAAYSGASGIGKITSVRRTDFPQSLSTQSGSWLAWIDPYGNSVTPPINSMQQLDASGANIFQDSSTTVPASSYQAPGILMEIQSSAPSCTPTTCFDNVLFLPGIESSRLYRTGDNRIWEPPFVHDNSQLAMNPDGTSVNSDIYTKDTLDTVLGVVDVYGSFQSSMTQLAANNGFTFEAFPYDWRYAADTIIANPVHLQTSTIQLVDEVKKLATQSKTGKVTIVAHSNGGLVAKELMLALGSDANKYVDRIIFVAVPQVGTPQAIAGLLHGFNEGLPFGLISDAEARSLGINMPFAYGLVPSAAYFTSVQTPLALFSQSTLPTWVAKYGNAITSKNTLDTFLTDNVTRSQPAESDLEDPSVLNSTLLSNANALHAVLDAWMPPAGVQLIQIAGWGDPKTVSGISYSQTNFGIKKDAQFTIDGDGTVVVPSALWVSTSAGAVDYWFDLSSYNRLVNKLATGRVLSVGHSEILSPTEVQSFISDIISNSLKSLSAYGFLSSAIPSGTGMRLEYSLHSPLTLDLYDDQGHHTGLNSSGQIEEQIPGTYYTQFGDVKYLFVDPTATYHIVMRGYATSTFTFGAENLSGDILVASTTWKNMPTTPSTIVTIDTSTNVVQNPLNIDENGDGNLDFSVTPMLNGVTSQLYKFSGFLKPINDPAVDSSQLSVFKAGSTIPVKFQLKDAQGHLTQASMSPIWIGPQKGAAVSSSIDESVYSDTGSTGTTYRWDSGSQQYIYNWNTKGLSAGYWYKVYAQLDDGSLYSVFVGLR